ncbi:MmcQ/YjbR family DNA-binding protein [Vibrio sp. ZSDE26]|uniref:MmcQ/YjbR family DNA-binding protein n=1 Tax=Vibrio amylolyticus TaxID=2847292 RepID=A0A9X1XKI0_9VIBR|nr:MmcQ/YjbR family DNA-binding protein [Vibrio amylolyticus]MCK6264617.1 MmcQ/YjbR family DNA-binding protein [Vibrio amylolyticus]
MESRQLEEFLMQFVAAEQDFPFGPEVMVFKVKGKMFALLGERNGRYSVNLKCSPEDGEVLASQFSGISPGYHMNKRHWITVDLSHDVEVSMIKDLCERSYQLVVSKLKKSDREMLNPSV